MTKIQKTKMRNKELEITEIINNEVEEMRIHSKNKQPIKEALLYVYRLGTEDTKEVFGYKK